MNQTQENFKISVAQEEDLPEIVGLVNSAYRGDSARCGWTHESDLLGGERTSLPLLTEEWGSPRKSFLCLREKEKLLACVALEFCDPPYCYLGMLTVSPKQQKKNLGKLLMAEAERVAKEKGRTRMILGVVHLRTELIDWYRRRGYKENGDRKPFPADLERFPRLVSEPLFFVMMEKPL